MNELINDEAVYRTAPATPGLLNMAPYWYKDHHNVLRAGVVFKNNALNVVHLLFSLDKIMVCIQSCQSDQ